MILFDLSGFSVLSGVLHAPQALVHPPQCNIQVVNGRVIAAKKYSADTLPVSQMPIKWDCSDIY